MVIKKVAVIGAGTMGSSIAMALISCHVPVILKDINDEAVKAGLTAIDRFMESKIKKGLAADEAKQQRSLVTPVTNWDEFSAVDLAIEAVAENMAIKKSVFQKLDEVCPNQAILASNTSSLSITSLGASTSRPDKVVGMHFFNPAHIMKLVEVVCGLDTSADTVAQTIAYGESLGKLAVKVQECASFLVNRLLGRYMNESLWCLQEGIAAVEEIDRVACEFAMPIGPLALRDMNGADIGLAVASFNFEEYGERFRPAPILQAMVEDGYLGQKTAQGFYLYDGQTKKRTQVNPAIDKLVDRVEKPVKKNRLSGEFEVERLFLPMINEAFLVLQEKICELKDLDPAMRAGLGMRKGPLALAADLGLAHCLAKLEHYFGFYGERFRPAPLLKRYVCAGRNIVS